MKVTINLKKRYAYIIIGLFVLATGIFVVNALTPGVAPNPGHVINEIAPPVGCADGQILQFIDGDWSCIDMSGGGEDTNADTKCSGTYMYLSGEGECRDVRVDGDLYDTGGSLSCMTLNSYGNSPQTASCPTGYYATGGGCSTTSSANKLVTSRPQGGSSWYCSWSGGGAGNTAYVRCCKIV